MSEDVDLAIIGAGPAGLAAAATAARAGLNVALLDEQSSAGGQIYRDIERAAAARGDILGKDYLGGLSLVADLDSPRIRHIRNATVWQIDRDGSLTYSVHGEARVLMAKRLLIASGALERPMPVVGWTLPGVMTAGAAQILLKQSGIVARDAVLIGSGPLLYLVAAQLCRVGKPPMAIVETQTFSDLLSAGRHLPGALVGWRYMVKGLGLLHEIRKAGVTRFRGASEIEIAGTQMVSGVRFRHGKRSHELACATVLLHHGVIPNTQIARSLDIEHAWDESQKCFVPKIDQWGRSDREDVFIAGDGAGIGGAVVAALRGRLAALEIGRDLTAMTEAERDEIASRLRAQLRREMAARPFIDTAYPPFDEAMSPKDPVIVCRCEEVTAGDIRGYSRLGCLGPNQAKAFGRSGMGPCQGRYCGTTVTQLLAEANGATPDETGYYKIRAPLKPVSLGEVAALHDPNSEDERNDRAH
ncbi:NAD(P)/FAD-dependent oxidoreductase [Tropicimonas sp. IMCC34011]|uniref:FAD/NAD(P)-dependent oxidoreductase n=1 Tax=Tropicimonas sp. IMCC34011 TaxID=2248759 RepID=UPI000E2614FD|nr:NAD(P)/FAD-dependent oxidoreductase [Tropicimonas sp. IMCC34011]